MQSKKTVVPFSPTKIAWPGAVEKKTRKDHRTLCMNKNCGRNERGCATLVPGGREEALGRTNKSVKRRTKENNSTKYKTENEDVPH